MREFCVTSTDIGESSVWRWWQTWGRDGSVIGSTAKDLKGTYREREDGRNSTLLCLLLFIPLPHFSSKRKEE